MTFAAFNQEKALVGAFSVIVQHHRLIDLRHYLRRVAQPRPQARVGGARHVLELQPLGDVEQQRRDEARQDEDHEVEHAGVAATWRQ